MVIVFTLPQLFGTQDEDIAVPNVVHTIILLNKNIFKPFFIPSSEAKTFHELCDIWAIQVEVVAAATAFKVPTLYRYQKKSQVECNIPTNQVTDTLHIHIV